MAKDSIGSMQTTDRPSPELDKLEQWAQDLVDREIYSSIALVGSGVEESFAIYTGGANETSLFDLASLTKPFLATTTLWLAANDVLDLNAPVFPDTQLLEPGELNPQSNVISQSLARGEEQASPVTLDLLLRHLSGAVALVAGRSAGGGRGARPASLGSSAWGLQ